MHNLYLVINMIGEMTDEQVLEFSQLNEGFRIERSANGKITMAPTHTETGFYNLKLASKFLNWNDQSGLGYLFDSSTGFKLPNKALRSPDVAWISKERWSALSKDQKKGYAQICPDFVLELRSSSDNLETLKSKMLEYIENGTSLAWLIDRANQQVYIYRADGSISIEKSFETKLSGETILPNFELDLSILNEKI